MVKIKLRIHRTSLYTGGTVKEFLYIEIYCKKSIYRSCKFKTVYSTPNNNNFPHEWKALSISIHLIYLALISQIFIHS